MTLPAGSSRVAIHTHPSPIPVAYSEVRKALPTIQKDFVEAHGGRHPDITLHIGIASTRAYYSVETQAHRDSYYITDIKGQTGFEDGEKLWREQSMPPVLRPGPTTEMQPADQSRLAAAYPPNPDFLEKWKSFGPPGADMRISNDAGRYLCEFIFFSSLAQALQDNRDRNVLFFHVPGAYEDAAIDLGTQVAIALIKTLATCWFKDKVDGEHSA